MSTSVVWFDSPNSSFSLNLEIADTRLKRQIGLSNRYLRAVNGDGMLFVYSHPTHVTFTVGNMRFPLVIAWFNEYGKFIQSRSVTPGPVPVAPPGKFQFVLEIPDAGNRIPAFDGYTLVFQR